MYNRNHIANTIAGQRQQYTGLWHVVLNKKITKLPGTSGRLRHAIVQSLSDNSSGVFE